MAKTVRIRRRTALVFVAACLAATAAESQRPMGDWPPHAAERRGPPDFASPRFARSDDMNILLEAWATLEQGRRTFRYDNFGNEVFWGDRLRLHEAIAGAPNGGVGPGVSPAAALELGLKVDVEALPDSLVRDLRRGRVDLDDPAVTVALLSLDAVVGVRGFVEEGRLTSIGITCALCHSTVDDSFGPGIGRRLDGWANRDLDVGKIIAAAPSLDPFVQLLGLDADSIRAALESWGPGKFDAHLILDGKSQPVLIPPAFGLAGVNLHTSLGWGSVTHWNAFVAVLEMQGQGTFYDPRLNDPTQYPVAARNGLFEVRPDEDLVTSKLGPLHLYQLAISAPRPPKGSFDRAAAKRGEAIFNDKARCAQCHVPPLFTEPGWNMHRFDEIGIDRSHAERGPEQEYYRTTPLSGLWTHTRGGFYHDGRFATLEDVVAHYDGVFGLGLSSAEKADLIEYLKSL